MSRSERTTYFVIYAVLLVLLAATVGASMLQLGLVAAITIAVAKAALIVWYFMHVGESVPLVRVFAVAGFLWLALLMTFLAGDYFTRDRVEAAPRAVESVIPPERDTA